MTLSYTNANEALPGLLHRVLDNGDTVESRNGRTKELTMQQITLQDPASQKEITVQGRKVSLPAQIAETMWILAGRNDVEWLSHYLPRAKDFSDDGATWRGGYGPRLRSFGYTHDGELWGGEDQLKHIVELLKQDPETRRAVFTIYNPSIDNEPGKDIPCNNWVHFLPREGTLHAHVAIRSNDLFWGWSGINAFEWTSLLQVVAGLVQMEVGSITFSISSLHLYERHWGKASDIVSNSAGALEPDYKPSPGFLLPPGADVSSLDDLVSDWFQLEGQIRKGGLYTALLHQIATFPEPMFRSWLFVLLAWHHDDIQFLKEYRGTPLFDATAASPKRKTPEKTVGINPVKAKIAKDREKFTLFVNNLHQEKNAAYGNSWMKRGEMLGIMANCARKVDRLGVGGAGDTAADTAIDLLVYFIKYDLWLEQQKNADWHVTEGQAHIDAVYNYLEMLERENRTSLQTNEILIERIKHDFDGLEHLVTDKVHNRDQWVKKLIALTYPLAYRLWVKEERQKGMQEAPMTHAERNALRRWNPEPAEVYFQPNRLTEAQKAMGLDGK